MRVKLTVLFLLLASVAWADKQNERGSSTAPISVTTTTKVLAGNQFRKTYCIVPEGTDIRCATGDQSDGAPATAPTTTRGFLVKSNTYFCINSTQGTANAVSPELRLDCASTGSAVSVDSFTSP